MGLGGSERCEEGREGEGGETEEEEGAPGFQGQSWKLNLGNSNVKVYHNQAGTGAIFPVFNELPLLLVPPNANLAE